MCAAGVQPLVIYNLEDSNVVQAIPLRRRINHVKGNLSGREYHTVGDEPLTSLDFPFSVHIAMWFSATFQETFKTVQDM